MNDDTRNALKHVGVLLLASVLGGLIGAWCTMHCMKGETQFNHMHFHTYIPRAEHLFKKDVKNFENRMKKEFRRPQREEFYEEDYIIIPKKLIDEMKETKSPEPFRGPLAPEKR